MHNTPPRFFFHFETAFGRRFPPLSPACFLGFFFPAVGRRWLLTASFLSHLVKTLKMVSTFSRCKHSCAGRFQSFFFFPPPRLTFPPHVRTITRGAVWLYGRRPLSSWGSRLPSSPPSFLFRGPGSILCSLFFLGVICPPPVLVEKFSFSHGLLYFHA